MIGPEPKAAAGFPQIPEGFGGIHHEPQAAAAERLAGL